MRTVQRYHAPLRVAFAVMDKAAPITPDKLVDPILWNRCFENALQMGCK